MGLLRRYADQFHTQMLLMCAK